MEKRPVIIHVPIAPMKIWSNATTNILSIEATCFIEPEDIGMNWNITLYTQAIHKEAVFCLAGISPPQYSPRKITDQCWTWQLYRQKSTLFWDSGYKSAL